MYGQRIKKKGTNNDLQNTTQKAKYPYTGAAGVMLHINGKVPNG